MAEFTQITSRIIPLPNRNVDTDQIIPARFLKVTDKSGLGEALFSDWRYNSDGSEKPDFVLNQSEHHGAKILLAGDNFGCGSSREHAPACMEIAGVRAVIAQSYARIFYRNSVDGGFFIPFECDTRLVEDIKTGDDLKIDLTENTLTNKTQEKTYDLKSLGEVIEIIEAGNIFEYARKTGMIAS